jgi:hypothetical protein
MRPESGANPDFWAREGNPCYRAPSMVTPALDRENRLENLATRIVESIQPSQAAVCASVQRLRRKHPLLSERALATLWAERVCRRYAAEGALFALPAVIPGLGTSVQLALEGGTIAADLAYMLHCMADIVMGVGQIFGRNVERPFKEEFVQLLGIWCGALSLGKEAAVRIGTKVAVAQAKRVPGELWGRLNRSVTERLLARLGLQRGPTTLGRLVPFGVGAVVGSGFNYATMRGFKTSTVEYYAACGDDAVLCA